MFAIGAMLWELCALQRTPPASATQRRRVLRRAGIDRDLVAIIDKALDPDPAGRYRDAGALATDLKAFKSGARVGARSYSLYAMLAHWTRRHRALAGSAGIEASNPPPARTAPMKKFRTKAPQSRKLVLRREAIAQLTRADPRSARPRRQRR